MTNVINLRPLLSIVMPTYNGEKFIAAALESVRVQGATGIELIIVDDGSWDATLDIAAGFARELPIRVVKPGRSGNWVSATNIGLREAKGEWACFLHQDDLWMPERLATLQQDMQSFTGPLIVHDTFFIGPDGSTLGSWTCPLTAGIVPSETFVERLLVQNFIASPSTVFRRQLVVESGGMDENLWFSADWDLWLRLGSLGAVRFVSESMSAFRIHPESQTMARKLAPGEWERQLTTVLRRHISSCRLDESRRGAVERAAMMSVVVNSSLSSAARGEPVRWKALVEGGLALGPGGWCRYLRDSRIVQRVGARVRLRASLP